MSCQLDDTCHGGRARRRCSGGTRTLPGADMSRAASPEVAASCRRTRVVARHQGIEPCCLDLETRPVPDGGVGARVVTDARGMAVPPEGLEPSPATFVASRPILGTVVSTRSLGRRARRRRQPARGTQCPRGESLAKQSIPRGRSPPPAPAGAGYAVPQGGIAGEAVDSPADVVRRRRQPARVRSAPGGNRTHHCWIERPADYPLSDWDRGRPSSTGWTTQTRARGTWSAGSLEGPAGIAASPVESERDGSPAQDSWRAVVFLPSDARPTRPLEEAAGTDASEASGGPGRNRGEPGRVRAGRQSRAGLVASGRIPAVGRPSDAASGRGRRDRRERREWRARQDSNLRHAA